MRALQRSAGLATALVCGLGLVACGGGDDGADVDSLTGCLEDAGLEVERGDVSEDSAKQGIVDELSVDTGDGSPIGSIQIGIFGSSDDAENYLSGAGESLKENLEQVGSILLFSTDTDTEEFDQAVSCAEDATG